MKTDPLPPPSDGDEPETGTLWVFPPGADLSFFERDPKAVAEIVLKAFSRAKDAAIRENDRLGIPSYGCDARGSPPAQAPMKYGYARVSPGGKSESVDAQARQLTKAGCRKVFRDVHVSGAKTDRTQLRRVIDQLVPGDVLMVTRLDRLAR